MPAGADSTAFSRFLRQAPCGRWSSSVDGTGCKRFSEQKRWESYCGQMHSKTRPAGVLTAERKVWDWNCCAVTRCAWIQGGTCCLVLCADLGRCCASAGLGWISQTVSSEQQTSQNHNIRSKSKRRTKCEVFGRDRWLSWMSYHCPQLMSADFNPPMIQNFLRDEISLCAKGFSAIDVE